MTIVSIVILRVFELVFHIKGLNLKSLIGRVHFKQKFFMGNPKLLNCQKDHKQPPLCDKYSLNLV